MNLFIILFVIGVGGLTLFLTFSGLVNLVVFIYRKTTLLKYKFDSSYMNKFRYVLESKNKYYSPLSKKKKRKFEDRVLIFMEDIEFLGREGLVVTDDMKIQVSASFIQLTFGLKKFLLTNYLNILLYPGEFYSNAIGRKVKGGVAYSNVIALSWPDFERGFAIGDDNYNLGLHEMAHALKCETIVAEGMTRSFRVKFKKWINDSAARIKILKERKTNYLRDYGMSNTDEFFSVCVEYFFESPNDFKTKHPEIYSDLCLLLNQDPSRADLNYSLETENYLYVVPKSFRFRFNYVAVEPYLNTVFIITSLISIFVVVFGVIHFIISASNLVVLFLLIIILFIPFTYFLSKRGFSLLKIFQTCTFFWLPLCLSLIFALNFFSRSNQLNTLTGVVKNVERPSGNLGSAKITYDKKELNKCISCRDFSDLSESAAGADSISFHYYKGLIGIPVINAVEFHFHFKKSDGRIINQSYKVYY